MQRRRITVLLALVAAHATTCEASAAEPAPSASVSSPAYTLEVDSDESSVVSYDALAARLSSELGAPVARPTGAPSRTAIAITYRKDTKALVVRAQHAGGRVLERSIVVQGDAASIQAEAVLLASNLARDEARELLDELAARPPRRGAEAVAEPAPPEATAPPEPPLEPRIATAGFLYPVATNYGHPDVRTPLDVSVLYGRVGRSEAVQFSFGVALASRGAVGVQLSTLGISGGPIAGAQLGLAGSLARGPITGAQLGGIAALSEGAVTGLQMAVGGSLARGPVDGHQLGAGFTFAGARVDGAQSAGGVNVAAGPLRGLQLSALSNLALQRVDGLQATAGANVAADRLHGAQLAVVNIGGDVTGAQVGIVNIGRHVKGLQLGVVNIAKEVDGAAIGLASIAKDSIHPIAWASNLAYTNVAIKFSTKYVYTTVGLGLGTRETDFDGGPLVTMALGGHVPLPGSFDVEPEVAYTQIDASSSETNHALHPRVVGGYSFAKHLRVFVGGGPRVPIAFDRGSPAVRPEVVAGVQF